MRTWLRRPRERTAWIASLVAVLGVNLVLALGSRAADVGLADREQRAMESAKARVASMLTFSHTDLEVDLGVASSNATGSFREEYAELLRSLVVEVANNRKVTTRSEVTTAAVTASSPDQVEILTFVKSTTTIGSRKPVVNRGRLMVTLQESNGEWLVAGMDPR